MVKSQGKLFSVSSKGTAVFQSREPRLPEACTPKSYSSEKYRWGIQWAFTLNIGLCEMPDEKVISLSASKPTEFIKQYEQNQYKRVDVFV